MSAEDYIEAMGERAAIYEFDGEFPTRQAESLAWLWCQAEMERRGDLRLFHEVSEKISVAGKWPSVAIDYWSLDIVPRTGEIQGLTSET